MPKNFNLRILSDISSMGITKTLWDHQIEALVNAEKLRQQGIKKGIAMQFTGTGKTTFGVIDALKTIRDVKDNKKQIFVVVPSQEIRSQWINTFKHYQSGIKTFETAIEMFDEKSMREADVIVTHFAYLHRYRSVFKTMGLPVGYVIIDEAHHMFAESYAGVRPEMEESLEPADLKVFKPHFTLGLTATPIGISGAKAKSFTSGQGQFWIQDLFDNHVIIDKTSEEDLLNFIHLGILVPIRQELAELPEAIYADVVRENNIVSGEEFDQGKIFKKIDRQAFYDFLIDIYRVRVPQHKKDKPTLVVALNIKDAEQMAQAFRQAGFHAEALHSDLPDKQQERLKKDFKNGDLKILIQVTMLAEGYDFPEIETLLMARPIYARHLYLQFLGRGLRAFEGKLDLLLIDVGWNFVRYASQRMNSVFNKDRIAEAIKKYSDAGENYIQLDPNDIQLTTHHFFENFILPIQKDELSTTMLSNRLEIAHTTLLNYSDLLKKVPGYRLLKIRGRETFVIKESSFDQVEKIIFENLIKKDEISITELSKLIGVSYLSVVAMENELKRLKTFRKFTTNPRYRFSIGKEDFDEAEAIIKSGIEPKNADELYHEEIADQLNVNHLVIFHMKDIIKENFPESFRELYRFGRQTFVIKESDLYDLISLVEDFHGQKNQLKLANLMKRFNLKSSIWPHIQDKVSKLPTYSQLTLKKGYDFVIESSDLIPLTKIIFDYQKKTGKPRDRISGVHLAKRLEISFKELIDKIPNFQHLPSFELIREGSRNAEDRFMIDMIDYENIRDILNG